MSAGPGETILVRVEPAGLEFPIGGAGMSLMAAAHRAGIRWPNVCGGLAQCGVCVVEVVTADEPLPEPSLREQQMLNRAVIRPQAGGTMRLACQLALKAGARLRKPGVRKPPGV